MLTEVYAALHNAGATPNQEHFSKFWCGMTSGYYRSRIDRPALEVLHRIYWRISRLNAAGVDPNLQSLRDSVFNEIQQRVWGSHAVG